ncbi:hypothetical protein FS592_12045 [Serratia plymuthica]|uniref:Uncharacterized protein n=1 Tax=Serratia plymuthica S13 TaxID=1348660 RepID=S4YWR5_SERPL|nr:hypothetical protein [Serratia plymuthica]AGP47003.1 hypothetical protein M621_12075 [Serratia plymuthica S13]ANJ95956.1 hypothetical protein ADP72_24365 [Serratia plymuthica]EKF64375.1 hypothetical protein B194_2540 [Serratia plymuthica A30]KYG17336.1 hypothetical protein SOD10_14620 [Serratia plymuthica]MBI6136686.1 hypothetical protein [Serratia plymuthica]
MLLLRARTATINNITFFADDSDDNQFWYLPGDIHIAQQGEKPVFSLIKYTGDGSDQQGGYINFEVNTAIDEAQLESAFNEYLRKLKVDPKTARKAQVPYDKGTVNFFVLDVGSANGELISAQCPSLFGNNSAIFSAKLTPEQAVILEAAFNQAQAPAAVAYNLSFTGITPALKVEVEARFESLYKEFDLKFGANIPIPVETPASFWLGFDSVIKKLQQDQKLIIKVTESMPSEEEAKEKEWALQFVKEEILKSFFTASLKPNDDSNTQAKSASDSILDSLISSGKDGEEGGKGGLFPSASLEIKLVRIEETKSLNFNYTSSKALSQSAVPQNFIGSDILRAKKEPPYFIEVNVNDPFFQRIDFTVLGPDGFAEYGIKAAAFKIEYNNQVYTADPFVADDGKWSKVISRSRDGNELFRIQSEFVFRSAAVSGWEGSSSYQPQTASASTLLNLDPGSVLTFNEIAIFLDRKFSWENYNQVIVELNYLDDKQSHKTKKYLFTEDKSDEQTFKYRCLTEKPWKVGYKITYFLVGGDSVVRDGTENPPAIVIPTVA